MRLDRNRQKFVTAIAVLLATTFIAGPAMAHGKRHHGNRHYNESRHHNDRHYEGRHYRGDDCRRGDRHHRRWERSHRGQNRHRDYDRRSSRHYPVYRHGYNNENARYYCAPCKHRFGSYDDLASHIHHRHRVALWQVPLLIVRGVLDGIFGFTYHGH